MNKLIQRPQYLEVLHKFKDKKLIKVITGIRRCGKSTLFDLYCAGLQKQGVKSEQIIRLNLESGDFYFLKNYEELYSYVKNLLNPQQMNYIFIDEVQNITDFQRAIDSLFILDYCDVYITGSNAYLLSGELATLLSGRFVEIKMLPLSFKEYLSFFADETDLIMKYNNYLQNSSFPYTLYLSGKEEINAYLEGIYHTILIKDIATRKKINNISILENVIEYLFDNIGNLCSSNKIANTLTSAGRKISVPTVEAYINALLESFIIYKANRYDVKGRQYLTTGSKYYVADIGLRYYLLGAKPTDLGHILENIVYLELLRRGYNVYVGKVNTAEIDFITEKNGEFTFYQVAYTVLDNTTLERELAPLITAGTHYPKYLLTMDFVPEVSYEGIKQLNVLDWLRY